MTRQRPAWLRRCGILCVAWILGGCAASAGSSGAPPEPPDGDFVAGYHTWWTGDSWQSYPFELLDRLYFFEIEARPDGSLERHGWPEQWSGLLARAVERGVAVTPTISMHDAAGFESLFRSDASVDSLLGSALALLAETPDVAGLHLDFEVFQTIDLSAREGFTTFVARLAERMRSESRSWYLSVFTLAFDVDDAYDERALGEIADYLVVQGYDYHSSGSSTAGPVAAVEGWGSLNWANVVTRFDSFGVPRRKLVMAVPLYGYEWPVESDTVGSATRGTGVTIPLEAAPDVRPELPRAKTQAMLYGSERDEASGTPWYRYEAADGWRQGWFEDALSLRRKFEFSRREGLGGVVLFPLAYGGEDVWAELRAVFEPPR